MQFTATQIATIVSGTVSGNPDAVVSKVAKIEEAQPGSLTFLAQPKYLTYLPGTKASVVIINKSFQAERPEGSTFILVEDAYSAFTHLLGQFSRQKSDGGKKTGIEQPSYVAPSARIGTESYIGAFTYIGEGAVIGNNVQLYPGSYIGENVIIEDDTILYPGVRVYHDCTIGKRVVIHAGTVIGADGFGFAPQKDGTYIKVPQIGNVIIEDDAEIGANTCIDRATMGNTIIRKGVKLDNLIQVAHNVELGANTVIAAQTGISGSTKVGQGCMIGGQVGMVGHIQIADGTRINAQSGLSKSVQQPNTALNGSPAFDYKSSLKSQAIFRNLPDLQQRVQQLEEQIAMLLSSAKSSNDNV